MRKEISLILGISLLLPSLLAACASLEGGFVLPVQHPMELERGKRPVCTECHEAQSATINYERMNHTVAFAERHRQEASQSERLCSLCHSPSFCSDCHAAPVELKPSLKNQTDNFRRFPHRGDYLSRHTIDGRIDPSSCMRCHGNPKAARTCGSCHG